MSVSLLPVILSSPNDPTVTLFWTEPEVSVVALVVFDASELFIDIPGPVVEGDDGCNTCRSS